MKLSEEKIFEILRQNAKENILPYFKSMNPDQIRDKGSADNLVTDADEASEVYLEKHLAALIPGSLVVGEEAVSRDADVLKRLKEKDTPVWVIDPIDGTYNFAHGYPKWGVFVSLCYKSEVVFGVMHDVLNDRFIFAKKGEGTWLYENGKKTRLTFPKNDKAVKDYYGKVTAVTDQELEACRPVCKKVESSQCALHDFWEFLTGQNDFVYHNFFRPWDHSVPYIVVTEAGGHFGMGPSGDKFDAAAPGNSLLATRNKQDWTELSQKLYAILLKKKEDPPGTAPQKRAPK